MHSYSFGEFALEPRRDSFSREASRPISRPRPSAAQALVEAAPRALSKAELQDRLWPDTFVVEANLEHLPIVEIRASLCDDRRHPRYVRTVSRFGYAFQEVPSGVERREPGGQVCRLRWDTGRATLFEGEHLIGRDPAADVALDSTAVSRVHARIRVTTDQVTLEDLGSKNGSLVGSRRVEGLVALADGDQISIGTIPMVVRIFA